MADQAASGATMPLKQGFSIPDVRHDLWAQLAVVASAWAAASGRGENSAKFVAEARAALAELAPLEEFSAFPGLRLMRLLGESLAEGDATGFAHQARRITAALSSGANAKPPSRATRLMASSDCPPSSASSRRSRWAASSNPSALTTLKVEPGGCGAQYASPATPTPCPLPGPRTATPPTLPPSALTPPS